MVNTCRVPSILIKPTQCPSRECDHGGFTRKLSAMLCVTETPIFGQSILLCSRAEKAVSYLNFRVVLWARWELGWSQGGLPVCLFFTVCMCMYQSAHGFCIKVKNKTKSWKQSPDPPLTFCLSCWYSSKCNTKVFFSLCHVGLTVFRMCSSFGQWLPNKYFFF